MFKLTIQLPHEERLIEVPFRGRQLLLTEVLRGAGLPLNTRCGQRGLCDGCLVELLDGSLEDSDGSERVELVGELLRGCELCVPATGTARIHLPARSLLAHQPQVVTSFRLNVPRAHDPLWQALTVRVEDLSDPRPLCESIRAAVAAELDCGLPIEWDAELTAVQPDQNGGYHVVLEHRGDHRTLHAVDVVQPAYGVAVDIGTTTVVVLLVELTTGRVVAQASALNAQTRLGDNVLTRINLCMTQPRLVQRMQRAVVRSTIAPLLSEAVRDAGIKPRQLACMVVAGNCTMLHLLLGVDPSSLGVAPFTPAFLEHDVVTASDLSLAVREPKEHVPPGTAGEQEAVDVAESDDDAESDDVPAATEVKGKGRVIPNMAIHLLPGAAGYVGADITSGVLASGMAYRDDTCLLVDLGTNGELVLRHKDVLVGCATAAGPAFEGAGLTYGLRAGDGAVGHIWLDQELHQPRIEVIGRCKPVGLCGTAYIDFVARARQLGLITSTARFATEEHPSLMRHEKHGRAFVVAKGQGKEPLLITEADMAALLQAKAAIAAGVTCLLRETQLRASDVQTVYLAGGFGFHMHVDSLLGCGMLPGFHAKQVELVGNTALAGAYLTLLDSGALQEIRRLSSQMKIIELNLAPDFESIYIDQLSLA